jgi:hypothetical protein
MALIHPIDRPRRRLFRAHVPETRPSPPATSVRSLAERAKREGVSLNMLAVALLAVALLAEGLGHRTAE